jgi:hypothetical protein
MPVPAPVTRATFGDAAIVGPPQLAALSSLRIHGRNAVLSSANDKGQ